MVKESYIDVEPAHLKLIKKILKRHITYKTVWAYGSRVNWTANQYSDLDLVVFDANTVKLGELKEDFTECDLPFSVDIVLWEKIPENFKNKIREKYVVLQKKPELEGWKECRLGNISSKIGSGATPRGGSNAYKDFGVSLIRSQNVLDFGFSRSGLAFIDDSQANGLKNVEIQENDVLLNITGDSVARCCIVPKNTLPARVNQHVSIIRLNPELADFKFVFYSLQYLKDELLMQAEIGATRKALTKGMVENLEILLPPPTEQKAIASVLSSLDDKIYLLHRQNKTLEAMAVTLFRQWFVEEAKGNWEETILGKHTEVFRGLSYKGSGLTENGFGIPMHNLNSVYEGGGYKYEGIKFYNGEYKERHQVNPGDIIVTNTEQGHEFKLIGFPAIVPDSFGETGLYSQHIYKLTLLGQTYLSNEFIYYLLMSSFVREQIISATNGSTVNMLAIDGLQRPEFKMPPKEKVVQFTKIVNGYWKKKNVNHQQINTLEKLRDTLLPKLMSGEVRVKYGN